MRNLPRQGGPIGVMLTERGLSQVAQEKLSSDFETVEAQQTGLGKHEQAEEFLKRLEKTYGTAHPPN